MRKALFLSVLLSLAACSSDQSDDSTGSLHTDKPTLPGVGDGEERGRASSTSGDAASPAPSGSVPVVASSGAGSFGGGAGAGSFGGAAGGVSGGSAGGAIGGGSVVPTVVGSSGSDAASGATTSSGVGVSMGPSSEVGTPLPPSQQQAARALTAGAWDDNLNYARFTEFEQKVSAARQEGVLPFKSGDFDEAHTLFTHTPSARQKLDIALVVDTTGSMGDEISYLQREFSAISSTIEAAYPDAEQRWSLVAYKDRGDEYVTRWYDFREVPEDFRQKLALLSAGGGGDFPEAPDAAFAVLSQFAWRTADDVARLAFWVADAPHHDANAAEMAKGIRNAQGLGIHVYPVASSGVDEFTELTMRTAAQLTGGRYLFLTNDSGIGGAHKEPSIPCYFVTSLNDAILRMVDIELSGTYREPEATEVIRTGGNPHDGSCSLASGGELTVF